MGTGGEGGVEREREGAEENRGGGGVSGVAGGRRLCGVSLGPLSSYPVMFCSVGQVLSSYAPHQRIRWITVCQQGTDGEQDLRDGQSWAPVILQDVQTNHTLTIDVAVIDPRTERDLWWLEGVIRRKGDVQKEHSPFVD